MALVLRRKKYIVDRGLQLRFARFVILFVFAASIVTGLVVFYTVVFLLGEKLVAVYPQGRLVEIFRSVYLTVFLEALVIIPLIFYGSIKFSHRIAGPLPKIYQTLRTIGGGDFEQKLVLRKNDELKELADAINEMTLRLKEREANK